MSAFELAIHLMRENRIDEAISCYQKAIDADPSNPVIYHALGEALKKQGFLDKAIDSYLKAIELDPQFFWSHVKLGDTLAAKGFCEKALDSYARAITLDPNESLPYNNAGNVLAKMGKWDEAIDHYKTAINIRADLVDLVFSGEVENVLIQQWWDIPNTALEPAIAFLQLTSEQGLNYGLRVILGNLLSKNSNIKDAIFCYRNASYAKIQESHPVVLENYWDSGSQLSPSFIIIGSAKAGTTSLIAYLVKHPQILPPVEKEIEYFNYKFASGLDWYLSHFPCVSAQHGFITGEATPSYIHSYDAPARICSSFPEAKIIVLLRNPIERVISHYYHCVNSDKVETRSLEEVIAAESEMMSEKDLSELVWDNQWKGQFGYLFSSCYVYLLQRWFSFFKKEQILILESEKFFSQTAKVMEEVHGFLGVPHHTISTYKNFLPGTYSSVNTQTRELLSEIFKPHNQLLKDFLNTELNWY